MKRSRSKCEPLAGISNQLATSSNVQLMVNIQPPNKLKRQSDSSLAPLPSSGSISGSDMSSNCGGKPVQQRNAANARERQRMRVLSKAFCRLKTSLPWVPPDTKLSKLDTLRLASCYIAHLKQILDDDQAGANGDATALAPIIGKSQTSSASRNGKQSSAILSSVSASTTKLLSMALPLAVSNNHLNNNNSNNQQQSTGNSRSQNGATVPPGLPLMSWPFAARTSSSNNGSSNGLSRNGNLKSSSSSAQQRQPGGHLGQLYAQFKDRLMMLPAQQQQQQSCKILNSSNNSSIPFPSPPSSNQQQIFSTPPSCAGWPSSQTQFFPSCYATTNGGTNSVLYTPPPSSSSASSSCVIYAPGQTANSSSSPSYYSYNSQQQHRTNEPSSTLHGKAASRKQLLHCSSI